MGGSITEGQPGARRQAALATLLGSSTVSIIAAIQSFVLMRIVIQQTSDPLMGAWLGSGDLLTFMFVFDFGLPNLMIQRIGAAHAQKDYRAIGGYFATGFLTLLVLVIVIAVAFVGLSALVPAHFNLSAEDAVKFKGCFMVAGLATCGIIVNYAFVGLARATQNTLLINIFNVAGVVLGFCVSYYLLRQNYGLWAVVWGLATRTTVAITGSLIFFVFFTEKSVQTSLRVERQVANEFLRISPSMFLSGVSNALMNDSQAFIALAVLGPIPATILSMTRRAADLVTTFLDIVNSSTYGGFAHLWGSGDKTRSRQVFDEIQALLLAVAFVLMTAYIALNPSFVTAWVGESRFGGTALTITFAAALILAAWSTLMINLYRATGELGRGSWAMTIECLVRVPLMVGLAYWLGLIGIPIGMIATSIVSGTWARAQALRKMPEQKGTNNPIQVVRALAFAVASVMCVFVLRPSWWFIFLAGALWVAVVGSLVAALDPRLGLRGRLARRFVRKIEESGAVP